MPASETDVGTVMTGVAAAMLAVRDSLHCPAGLQLCFTALVRVPLASWCAQISTPLGIQELLLPHVLPPALPG